MSHQEDSIFDSVGPWVVVAILGGLVLIVIIQAWRALRREWAMDVSHVTGHVSAQPREIRVDPRCQLQVVVLNPTGSVSMGTHSKS